MARTRHQTPDPNKRKLRNFCRVVFRAKSSLMNYSMILFLFLLISILIAKSNGSKFFHIFEGMGEVQEVKKFNQTFSENEKLNGNKKDEKTPYFLFYRILGNDMPPLQSVGQLRWNTEYAIKYESNFKNCEKRWVLNRIVNSTEKSLILKMLQKYGYESNQIVDIPFDFDRLSETYFQNSSTEISFNRLLDKMKESKEELQHFGKKIRDLTDLNKARNYVIDHGIRSGARWILCFDGNQFLPETSWKNIFKAARNADKTKDIRYIEVPMVRLQKKQNPETLTSKSNLNQIIDLSEGRMEEGQIIFRNDSKERFNENMAYSLAPKQELMDRVCSFTSKICVCHDKVWWWFIKSKKSMLSRITPCGVTIRLWSYPEEEALNIKDGNARRDMRLESAKRYVKYVEGLLSTRREQLAKVAIFNDALNKDNHTM